MTGMEPDGARRVGEEGGREARSPWAVSRELRTGRPIVWKWWALAGFVSLAIWAGVVALVM